MFMPFKISVIIFKTYFEVLIQLKVILFALLIVLLIYMAIIYLLFLYTFAKNRGPLGFLLRKVKPGGDYLNGYEDIISEGIKWAKAQPFTDEYTISSDGLKLHASYLDNNSNKTVICVHGYRSSGFGDFSLALKDFYELGNNLLVIDQRARGQSEGKYITFGIKEGDDCISWANHMLKTRGINHKVFFDGVSMGASSVIYACSKGFPENVGGLIADCGFSCPWDIIAKVMKDTIGYESPLIMHGLNILSKLIMNIDLKESISSAAKTCNTPCIIAHGTDDSFVPYEMGVKLYNEYKCPDKVFIKGEGANHGMTYMVQKERYTNEFIKLFNK